MRGGYQDRPSVRPETGTLTVTLHEHAAPACRSRPTPRLPSPSTLLLVVEPYYDDGTVRLYLGNCLEITEWLSADVLCTDPPYGIGWKRGTKPGTHVDHGHAGIANDTDTTTRDAALTAWGSRPGLVFGSFYAPPPADFRHVLVYGKAVGAGVVGSTTGWRRDLEPIYLIGRWPLRPATWSSYLPTVVANAGGPGSPPGKTGHPHTKPLDVMEALISACPPGVIADPFSGSGSTLLAARNLGRQAIGVELEERYCEVAAKRLQQMCLELG